MGRIIPQVKITNPNEDKSIICSMFVATGAFGLILPIEGKNRFGK